MHPLALIFILNCNDDACKSVIELYLMLSKVWPICRDM